MIQTYFKISVCFRMTTDSTQTGHIPIESLLESNNDKDFNIDQLLTTEIVIISQQPLLQFNAINMIPSQIPSMPSRMQSISSHIPEHENRTWNPLGRRRRRRRQRQRRQQRHRQQQERPQQLIRQPQYRRWSSPDHEHEYWERMSFPEFIEENISPALEIYYWETMNLNERQETWEQNHLNELQRQTALEQQDSWDYLEAFAVLKHLTLIQNEREQIHQIHAIENLKAEERQQRYNAEQTQLQQWEQNHFEEHAIEEQ